jgi:hypothetical protein
VSTSTLIAVGCKLNIGSVLSTTIRKVFLPISETDRPIFDFVDTGLLNNDGITNNSLITAYDLEVGATWQYSISDDNGFVVLLIV